VRSGSLSFPVLKNNDRKVDKRERIEVRIEGIENYLNSNLSRNSDKPDLNFFI